jgi:hypothetical protein
MDFTPLAIFGILFLLAFLVESLTEYVFGAPMDKIPALTPYKWLLMYIALAVGLVGAFVYRLDLIYIAAGYLGVTTITAGPFGFILTGLAIGRGSNYIHEIFGKIVKAQP